MNKYIVLNYFALIFGLISSLVLLITLYQISLTQDFVILIRANTDNEFWFEYIAISVFTLVIFITIIIKIIKKE